MSIILISAYINIEDKENTISREQIFAIYKQRGQKLINLPIPKIIFIDADYISEFEGNSFTRLIPIKFQDLEIYKYYEYIYNNDINILSPNPNKDTTLFHLIQIAKTEFITKGILYYENNPTMIANFPIGKQIQFGWIDFGINKIFHNDFEFEKVILNLPARMDNIPEEIIQNKIMIPGCWSLNNNYPENTGLISVMWYFCGGFFLGERDILFEFEKEVKKELKFILEVEKKLIFEVNIWYRIWKKGFPGFNWYYGDHNASMFLVSFTPTERKMSIN